MTEGDGRVYLNGDGITALPLDMSEFVMEYVKNNTLVSQIET